MTARLPHHSRTLLFTVLAMLAFAGNSLLCRLALSQTQLDAASFTAIRLLSGALVLWLLLRSRKTPLAGDGSWGSALALFVYAAGFSYAYLSLTAATGALLLFGAVQATMIGHGLRHGERLCGWQLPGLVLAIVGLIILLLPGLAAPPLMGTLLMLAAGMAWGIYSLRGRGSKQPLSATAGNFIRAVPLAALFSLLTLHSAQFDMTGALYAIASGALTSGIGYAIWYAALPGLTSSQAATVQLSVPALAAMGASLLLDEILSARLLLATGMILGGIALVILAKRPA